MKEPKDSITISYCGKEAKKTKGYIDATLLQLGFKQKGRVFSDETKKLVTYSN